MPGENINTKGFVLDRSISGEHYLRFALFTQEHGLLNCYQRHSNKNTKTPFVELFDYASVTLERKDAGNSFVKEYHPLDRYNAIGKNYQTLLLAAEWTTILTRNLPHASHFEPIFQLNREALDAFERSKRPDVVLLKALWRLARDEGYPVKQQFWANQPTAQREELATLIHNPADATTIPEQKIKQILDALRRWLRDETDIMV